MPLVKLIYLHFVAGDVAMSCIGITNYKQRCGGAAIISTPKDEKGVIG